MNLNAWLFGLGLVMSQGLAADRNKPPNVYELEGRTQGTSYHIRYVGPEQAQIQKDIEGRLKDFDKIFSNYRADSEISRFNARADREWFPVDPQLASLVQLSQSISEQSKGAFDITIGPLLKVWGFGPYRRKEAKVPTDAEIKAAQKLVDYRQLQVRQHPPALRKLNPGLAVDLSGIAQGYSVDVLNDYLKARGVEHFLVEIGGEIRTHGVKAPGQEWELAIESPSMEPTAAATRLQARDKSLTTAGDYRESFEVQGKTYSHTIDPRSGRPVEHPLASVSVIAGTAAEADGWDTAFMVLGPEASRQLAREKRLAALLIIRRGTEFITESVGGFEQYLKRP